MSNHNVSDIRNPDPNELAARDELLQECLRNPADFSVNFSIRAEYPIVLNPEARAYSHLAFADHKPVAHLNALPRAVHNQKGEHQFDILLIGNVCTHPKYRGRGLIRALIDKATILYPQCSAMVLWSDLDQFYQKLGFSSLNQEIRYFFNASRCSPDLVKPQNPLKILNSSDIQFDLKDLEDMRPKTPLSLSRAGINMRQVFSTPQSHFIYLGQPENPLAYAFIGKGADLQGVIHEWGARDCQSMLDLIAGVLQMFSLEQIILLAPASLDANWQAALQNRCEKKELHPMALAKSLGNFDLKCLNGLYIWGWDSI